ncbi:SprT-like domain-containing protein [Candidatus Woesearchaeota archaeon]|nr:SprT-like domain-containing protein [Candidatus Woesearchaeota archaeon]
MSIAEEAFELLFSDKGISNYNLKIKYHDKFNPYNANVRYTKNSLQFNLSRKWKKVSKEIQIGLIQELMLKVFKEKKSTINIDLYNNFIKNLHISVPKVRTDKLLEESFNKLNEQYFFGLLEKPNLMWHNSLRKLGSYEYGTDTISISEVLSNDKEILDYVMYHEMLHKKHKFHSSNGRTCHHTKEFKKLESMYENSKEIEGKIKNLIRQEKRNLFFTSKTF